MTGSVTIKGRFSTVFLLVLLVVIVLGAFSISRLAEYHTFSAEIERRLVRNTQSIGDLNNYTSDFRAAEATTLLAENATDGAANVAKRQELDREIGDAKRSFEAIGHEPPETQVYTRFIVEWSAYRSLADQTQALAASGRRAEGVQLYMTLSRAAYDAASDTLGQLDLLNIANAQRAVRSADLAYRDARSLTAAAVGFVGVVVFGCLLYMRQSIANPLLALARCMRALAGSQTDVEIVGAGRADEIGEMARAVIVFRDNVIDLAISQRNLAAQASLLAEKLAAEQRLTQLQDNFVAMASHEFRTPLTVVDGQAQRIINAGERMDRSEIAQRAGRIRAAVRRITGVMENMMESSRLMARDGELYFHPDAVDLRVIVNDVCGFHRDVVPHADIFQDFGTEPLMIFGDRKLMFQAISNLLSNAVKYSPSGSPIRVRASKEAQHIKVEVEDKGLGIAPQEIDRLFDIYFRGRNVSGIVGTGVGLYLVKTVVDLHRGSITVESTEGAGSKFILRLPTQHTEAAKVTSAEYQAQ